MPPAAERLGNLEIDDQLESGPRSNFCFGSILLQKSVETSREP
jgi:hypothetical protein